MRSRLSIVASLLLLTACSETIRHPLDDSESKPSTLEAAVEEASDEMDEVGAAALAGGRYASTEWTTTEGCGISPDYPEQGEVSRVLERSYASLPSGATQSSVLDAVSAHWDSAGHRVGEGSPTMEEQRIARIHGISYAAVSVDVGIDLRAFLPCY
jgi:hypothetical protein